MEIPATVEMEINGVMETVPTYINEDAAGADQTYLGHCAIPVENEDPSRWTSQEAEGFTTLVAPAPGMYVMPPNPHPGAYPFEYEHTQRAVGMLAPGVAHFLITAIAKIIMAAMLLIMVGTVLQSVLFHAIDKSTEFNVYPLDPEDPTNPYRVVCKGNTCQYVNTETGEITGTLSAMDPLMTIMLVGLLGLGVIIVLPSVVKGIFTAKEGGK